MTKGIDVAYAKFAPCPHCQAPLCYLESAAGSKMNPTCPRCRQAVPVSRPTFLMADYSRPSPASKTPGGVR